MNILRSARRLESHLSRTVDRAAQRLLPPAGRQPLEIAHAIVDRVEEEIQPAGRGRHVFPFNRIRISIAAPSPEARARLGAVLEGDPSLQARICSRLESAGCAVDDLAMEILYRAHGKPEWQAPEWHVEFERAAAPAAEPPRPPIGPPRIKLSLVSGTAGQLEYAFAQPRINLGRCAEVRDRRSRLVRVNHVAFADSDAAPNQSVSRRHAHLEFDEPARQYRVYDDHSKQGTEVLRHGKTIAVPPGSRGVALQPGDEILLGEARVRFSQKPAAAAD